MAKSTTWEAGLLALLFNNTAFAGVGDTNGLLASVGTGSLYVSLHTADPTAAGNQTSSEVSYGAYARVAGLLAGAQHTNDHAGENRVLRERGGNAFAAFDIGGGSFDGFFHDGVADGLRDDLQYFQNRHAAAHQRGQRAGEARETNLVGDDAEDR